MQALSIGMSALQVNQRVLDLIGQNISNANTPGYHRRDPVLATRTDDRGSGVTEIAEIRRRVDQVLESSILQNTAESSSLTKQADGLRQIEALMDTGPGSLTDLIERFFNQAEQLTQQPDDMTQRRVVLSTASAMADQLNLTLADVGRLSSEFQDEGRRVVDQINTFARQIGTLNVEIQRAEVEGTDANSLKDRRDLYIQQLSELIDVRVTPQMHGQVNVLASGVPLVLNNSVMGVRYGVNSQNQVYITATSGSQAGAEIPVDGGQLAGIFKLRNEVLPKLKGNFEELADGLLQGMTQIHAQGLGRDGPLTFLSSERSLPRTNIPISLANLPYPPTASELVVGITNKTTGQRELHSVNLDPATMTLEDVATTLSTIPHLQVVTDAQSATLKFVAEPGFGFDFTGRLPNQPGTSTMTGTASPTIGGKYTGNDNDSLSFRVVGNGTVGISEPLTLEVRNGAGNLLANLNIGLGYEPGAELPAVEGVKIKLNSGTVNNGEEFSVRTIADSDPGHWLGALGIQPFFVGDPASSLRVSSRLLDDPSGFALSTTGEAADATNLSRFLGLRDQKILDRGTKTFRQYLANTLGDIGSQIQDVETRVTASETVGQKLEEEWQSVSGVDPNEELVRLLQYQRAFQMAARYVSVVNETMDDLLRVI